MTDQPISTPTFVSGTPDWVKPIIEKASATHNIPTIILSALLKQESGFNTKVTSRAGAQGIAQFMPGTAKGMGVNPWDPESAVDGAARYLANGMKKFGKMNLALAAYNAGSGAVSQYGGVPPYKETQNYVKNILAMAGDQHQSANGPVLDFLNQQKKENDPIKQMRGTAPTAPQKPALAQPDSQQPQEAPPLQFVTPEMSTPSRPSMGYPSGNSGGPQIRVGNQTTTGITPWQGGSNVG